MSYLFQKRPNDLFIEIQNRLKSAGITDTGLDSVSNILVDIVTSELSSITSEFNSRLDDFNLSAAEGEALDELVFNLYGFNRLPESKAYSERSFIVTNLSGSETITIPEGTKISDGTSFNEDGIIYMTTEEITVSPSDNEVVGIVAEQSGVFYNVAENVLTNIDFQGRISCTNQYAIVNGFDRETDSRFRSRALNYIQGITNNNLEYLRYNLLEVPGIYNLKFAQGYRGIGSMSVFAVTSDNKTDDYIENNINTRINEVAMPGEKIYFEKGTEVKVNLEFLLLNTVNFSDREIENIKFSIRRVCADYFVDAKRRSSLNFSTLENLIKNNITNYNFLISDSDSIFTKISYVKTDPNNDTETGSINLASSTRSIPLEVEDVPVLGNIEIVVELTL